MEDARTIISGDKVHRPLLDETLTEDDLRVAKDELYETPEKRKIALTALKERLTEQDDFSPRTDDVFLLRFLRCRKFDLDRAYKMIREHYKFRKQNPKIFPPPSSVEKALRTGIFDFLPHRDHKGRAIIVVRFARWNPNQIPYNDFVAALNLACEYVLDNAVTQINGYIGIWDMKSYTLKQFMVNCSPRNMILLTTLALDRFPARFKVAYCVNCVTLVNTAWTLFRPLLKEKFSKRVQILGPNMTELHSFVDPSILPEEFGGTFTTNEKEEFAQRVLDKEAYTNYNRKFGF